MRLFISGSAPLLEQTFHEFENKTGQKILERYGMTETGINTSNPLIGEKKPASVGHPLPSTQIRIINNKNQVARLREAGQIQVKGDNVFKGYWKNKNKECFTQDNYFCTGDVGIKDEDGYIFIVGRAKDMIISGGINIYPKELENFINKMKEIQESVIIGLPHQDFGEAVTAIIVPQSYAQVDEKMIIQLIKNNFANYKVPKKVIFAENLPRNAMGKIQKNKLKAMHAHLYDNSYS